LDVLNGLQKSGVSSGLEIEKPAKASWGLKKGSIVGPIGTQGGGKKDSSKRDPPGTGQSGGKGEGCQKQIKMERTNWESLSTSV